MSTTTHPTSVDSFEITRTGTPVPDAEREAALASPKFGTVFTEHMARITYTHEDGWTQRRVEKYGPLLLDPATAVLHYGQEIFEGMKAYRHADGSVWTFRPRDNAAGPVRLTRSAAAIAVAPGVAPRGAGGSAAKAAVLTPEKTRIAEAASPAAAVAAIDEALGKEDFATGVGPYEPISAAPPSVSVDSVAPETVTVTGCLESSGSNGFRLTDTDGIEAPRSRSWRSGSSSVTLPDASTGSSPHREPTPASRRRPSRRPCRSGEATAAARGPRNCRPTHLTSIGASRLSE